jgi:hypothetical protein
MSALPPPERTTGAEILVVEDELSSRETLIDILEGEDTRSSRPSTAGRRWITSSAVSGRA